MAEIIEYTAIKSYTDIEQSKKLANILPLGSADMYYCYVMDIYTKKWDYDITPTFIDASNKFDICDIPCWSLAALLGVLHDYTLQTNTDGTVFVVCESKKPMISDAYDNPVDACYEMILKLHKLKML